MAMAQRRLPRSSRRDCVCRRAPASRRCSHQRRLVRNPGDDHEERLGCAERLFALDHQHHSVFSRRALRDVDVDRIGETKLDGSKTWYLKR